MCLFATTHSISIHIFNDSHPYDLNPNTQFTKPFNRHYE